MKSRILLFVFSLFLMDCIGQIGFEEHVVVDNSNTADGPIKVYSVDIDGDTDMDIVSLSFLDHKIAWYENLDSSATFFQHIIIIDNLTKFTDVFLADLDGDGDLDIIASAGPGSNFNKLEWYENLDGTGDFSSPVEITTNLEEISSIYAADLDGDGDMDLISGSRIEERVSWFENLDGQGNFNSSESIIQGNGQVVSVFSSDLDGDGDMDILSAANNDGNTSWYENEDGLGSFSAPNTLLNFSNAVSIHSVDLDNDGDMDILTANNSNSNDNIHWFRNEDGQGTFSDFIPITNNSLSTTSIHTSDIDNDGDMDLIAATSSNDEIFWLENIDGLGNFGTHKTINLEVQGANSIFSTDLDNDGDIDVLSSSFLDDKIAWYENLDGQGDFGNQQLIVSEVVDVVSIDAGDIDGDGDLDLITASNIDDRVQWYENIDGQGNYISPEIIPTNSDGAEPRSVVISDINNDGNLDFVCIYSHKLFWYENLNGQVQFSSHLISDEIVQGIHLSIIDIDNDGDLDILSADYYRILWYENLDGQGSFGARQIITNTVEPTKVLGADFDGDGDIDVLSSSNSLMKIAWYENLDGAGDFGTEKLIISSLAYGVVGDFTDIDGDGDIDVLSNFWISDELAWYENLDGLGNFGIGNSFGSFTTIGRAIHANDLDGDGDNDILSGTTNAGNLFWFENIDGLGSFGVQQNIVSDIKGLQDLLTVDIDNDGDLDIVSISEFDKKIAWFENNSIVSNETIEINRSLNFSIYPIPTSGILTIQSESNIAQIEIYDRLGQLLVSNFNKKEIDLSSLSRGFYFCKIKDEDGNSGVKKVVKE